MENASSMEFLLLQEVQFVEVNDEDLPQWEIVDVLDSEEAAEEDEDGDGVQQMGRGSWASSISWSVPPEPVPTNGIRYRLFHFDDPDLKDRLSGDRCFDGVEDGVDGPQSGDGDADGYGEGEDGDDYNGYGLDDELVPWSVNCKFGRQRMRKLGKRVCSKMNNSKRSPHLFVKPGCVRGKHGLGLKHNF